LSPKQTEGKDEKMSKQMNWRRAALHGKPVLDHRYEFDPDYPDRAARWLRAVENQRERRSLTTSSSGIAIRSSR